MRFNTFGNINNPTLIMLSGSFAPGKSMENIYGKLKNEFYIIVPDYTGHYEGSGTFTTRRQEAEYIKEYIIKNKINNIKLIYGQSMGTEIGMELLCQLLKSNIKVEKAFFDGAPFIKLSFLYKKFMYFKFKTMINLFRNKSIDEVMNWKFLKKFAGDKVEQLRPMIESVIQCSPYLTNKTIKNEVECCYTFDFPPMTDEMQKNILFFYGEDEKAYKTCIKGVKKAYPQSEIIVKKGQGHLTYACEFTDEYINKIKDFI
ncbi:MAG: alpha/beta hydrolase [Clostridia bacterium]|nr:alpha/beta hydrolase [Clostridia bacterium]